MKRARKLVGIMVADRRYRKRVLQTYRSVTPKHIKLFTFTPSSIHWATRRITGVHYANGTFKTQLFPFPGVVYNRCYGANRQLLRRIENVIGKNRCFNHVNHFDKEYTYRVLQSTELDEYLPVTVPYNKTNLDLLLAQFETLYVKPVLGNRGRGVYRVNKSETGEVYISEHYFLPSVICREQVSVALEMKKLTHAKKYVVQQGISSLQADSKNFDIRVLVQKDQTGSWGITNIMSRIAYSGCFNTSVCENVTTAEAVLTSVLPAEQVQTVLESLTTVSLKCARYLGENGKCHLGELSVDFTLDTNGALWIIEINGNPQRTLYKDLTNYTDVYRNPIGYAEFLLSQ